MVSGFAFTPKASHTRTERQGGNSLPFFFGYVFTVSDDLGGFDFPGGASAMANQKDNKSAWYKRWYVWPLPLLVLGGTLLYAYN
jgi:hypothetical protein